MTQVILDTRQISISKVEYCQLSVDIKNLSRSALTDETWKTMKSSLDKFSDGGPQECTWRLGQEHEAFGTPLTINLPSTLKKNTQAYLKITYKTSPNCSAAQWLDPVQTKSKKFPYFFTQCQAIHARSLFPCQDSPEKKFTYSASVTTPKPLTAVMSAIADGTIKETQNTRTFNFVQYPILPCVIARQYLFRSILSNGHNHGQQQTNPP